MKLASAKIQFCFPEITHVLRDKRELVKSILKTMRENGSIDYAGYLKDGDLYKDLLKKIGDVNIRKYQPLNIKQKNYITKVINSTLAKCYRNISDIKNPIFIFVFPWLPSSKDKKTFKGVNAIAPYKTTIHLFISPYSFTRSSLMETIAHEFSHLVFYKYQKAKEYTLFEHIVMEGIAENFREEIIGGKPAAWAVALKKIDAMRIFISLKPLLNSKSVQIRKRVLLGNGKYSRWTGYSIGYWLVKEFREKHPKINWKDIMQMEVAKAISR